MDYLSRKSDTDEAYDYDQVMAEAPEEAVLDLGTWRMPGPVSAAFMACRKLVKLIMGPFGSGKTSTCFFEILMNSVRLPYFKNGERIMRVLVLRDTYRNLYKTTVASWWEWFPPSVGVWHGGQDRPARHEVTFEDEYGVVRVIVEFEAVGDKNLESFFKGRGFAMLYLNEADGFIRDVLQYGIGRLGRFPKKSELQDPDIPVDVSVIMDCNAPDIDSWIYEDFVENIEQTGYGFFRQPGGLEPGAENIGNLPDGYYERMLTNEDWWVKRNVHNEFGYSRAGDPVFKEEFIDKVHFATKKLEPIPGLPINIDCDAGGHPAALLSQTLPNGQDRYFCEITNNGGGVGPTRFAEQINYVLDVEYPGFEVGDENYADPTAFLGGDKEGGDFHYMQTVMNITGITFKPAPSNEIPIRLEASRQALTDRIDGEIPAVVFCPSMKVMRRGFNSGYQWVRKDDGHIKVDKPMKDTGFDHPQDCFQYGQLGRKGLKVVTSSAARRQRKNEHSAHRQGRRRGTTRRATRARTGFSPC